MREYCRTKSIPLNDNGKVVVARSAEELPVLRELHTRSQANGVRAELVDCQTLKDIEPCAKTVEQALHVNNAAVVNPQRVMEALVADAMKEGGEFRLGCAWRACEGDSMANTSQGRIAYGHLVNCAELFADKIAHQFDVGRQYRILPFRGQFYRLRPESKVQVRGNIYPVPDLRNHFLGVQFTRRPEGEVTVGPSALPLLGREQYQGLRGITVRDGLAMMRYLLRLFGCNRDYFRSIAWREMRKLSRSGFFQEAHGLEVGLETADLPPGKEPGIRAQLVDTRTAELLNDLVVEPGPRSTHVLNAVSPAFTSSAPFVEYVVSTMRLD